MHWAWPHPLQFLWLHLLVRRCFLNTIGNRDIVVSHALSSLNKEANLLYVAGARRGLLIRGGDILEKLAKVDTVVLDKTGTLTEGKLRLKELEAFAGYSRSDVLTLAASVENLTTHPLASAVKQAATEEGKCLFLNNLLAPLNKIKFICVMSILQT